MIKSRDAIAAARSLIGTPYSELDCINLIKKVIRASPGGVSGYTTAGTNTLWRSYEAAAKYRDLTWRQSGLDGARAGMLAFKASGMDWHHVGLVTGDGTVIHSSSAAGGRGVVETPLTDKEGWTHLAIHRYIAAGEAEKETEEKSMATLYKARVATQKDPLRVRDYPATGEILGHVPRGAAIEVLEESESGWKKIRFNELEGWASAMFIEKIEEEEADVVGTIDVRTVLTDSTGNTWEPVGEYTARTVITIDGTELGD